MKKNTANVHGFLWVLWLIVTQSIQCILQSRLKQWCFTGGRERGRQNFDELVRWPLPFTR